MQIREVRLRNLRSYVGATLRLGPGTTLLVGDVGAGKTSLLYAIEMALFGFAEVDPAYLVRHGAASAEVALVLEGEGHRYEFVRRFRRARRKGRDVFEVEEISYAEDGARRTYSATEIRQRAIDLLGFPDNPNPRAHSDLWRWAVYVPQERMREVLAQDPEERLATVRKALGLEEFKTAAENAQLVATELRSSAKLADAEAEAYGQLAGQLLERRAHRDQLSHDVGRLTIEVRDARATLAAAEAADAELVAVRREFERSTGEERQLDVARRSLDAEHERVGERRQRLTEQIAARSSSIVDVTPAEAELDRLRTERIEMERLRSDRRSRQDVAAPAARELAAATAAAVAAHASRQQADRLRGEAESEVHAREAALAALLAETPQHEPPPPTRRSVEEIDLALTEGQRRLTSASEARAREAHVLAETEELLKAGRCPKCGQAVTPAEFAGHRAEQAEALARTEAARAELDAAVAELRAERGARERYDRALQRWREIEARRATAREGVTAAAARRDSATADLSRASGVEEEAERRQADLGPAAAEYEKLTKEANELDRLLAELTPRIDRMAATVDESRRTVDELARLRTEAASVDADLVALLQRRDALQVELARVRERRERAEGSLRDGERVAARVIEAREAARRSEIAQARTEADLAGAERRVAESERAETHRQERHAEAERRRRVAEWLGRTFHDEVLLLEQRLMGRARADLERHLARFFATLVEDPTLVARCDATFAAHVEIEGEWTPAEALSGGERTALALAFRLALGLVVRSLGRLRLETMVLDEPTDGFSPEQVVRMGELLDELGLPQVILVSHELQLGAAADAVVRVRKVDGVSELDAPGERGEGTAERPTPVATRTRRRRTPRLDEPANAS